MGCWANEEMSCRFEAFLLSSIVILLTIVTDAYEIRKQGRRRAKVIVIEQE